MGRTPLMHAVLDDEADAEVVTFVVKKGANVNATDAEQKWTALHLLLASGSDPEAKNYTAYRRQTRRQTWATRSCQLCCA